MKARSFVLRTSPPAGPLVRPAFAANVGNVAMVAIVALVAALLVTVPCASAQLVPSPASGVDQPALTAAFTPGQALPVVLETIRDARLTIFVAAYSFTSRPIATALRDAARRGVRVYVLVDAGEATKRYSAARFLANQGVPVRINAHYATQHNKFMVVDAVRVQTGSFNYTSSAAERNAENVLVVSNAPALAAQYSAQWRRLWDQGTDLGPAY